MTNQRKITSHCEIFARKSKQSISAIRESKAIRLPLANLRLDSSIHFWVIDSLDFLKSRDLDCFGDKSPRNDSKTSPSLAEGDKGGGLKARNNSSAKFSNNESTHPLAPSAREGEAVKFTLTREGEFFASLTLPTKESK